MRLIDADILLKKVKEEGNNQAEQRANKYDSVVMAYGDCYGMIESAPTINQMNWKLCSLESPEEGELVMLTFKNLAGLHVGEATFKNDSYYYVAETDNGYFEEMYGIPIAWMKSIVPYNPNMNK